MAVSRAVGCPGVIAVTPDHILRGRLVETGPHKSAGRPESSKKYCQVGIYDGHQSDLPSRPGDLGRVRDEDRPERIAAKRRISGSVFKDLALALVSGGDSRLRIDRGPD